MVAARVSQMTTVGNQPRTWALSCMIFALILETSRRSSPTTAIMQSVSSSDESSLSFNDKMKREAVTTIGDYTFGGVSAGLVGAFAGWTQNARTTLSANAMQIPASILSSKAGRRPLIVWGLGAGMLLGLVAGLFQAGIDGLSMYLQKEQDQEHNRQSEPHDEDSTA
jgi:MFS family permease